MERAEYEFIYERLNTPEDAETLNKRMGYPKNMLFNILGKKVVRKTLKDYYRVKRKEDVLLKMWKRGDSIYKLSKNMDFPPVLMASFILSKMGLSKKEIQSFLKDPDSVADPRLRREIKKAVKEDFIYAPWAKDIQSEHGGEGERKLEVWLEKRKIEHLTEKESRRIKHHQRTPDVLLKKPIKLLGKTINWIESKSSFGDDKEVRRDYKRQLQPYVGFFGSGMVVYWYGFIDDIKIDPKVTIVSGSFFKPKRKRKKRKKGRD